MVDDEVTSDCLIKVFPTDKTKLRLYSLLKNIRRPCILSVQNFYEVSGQPRFVFSWADGSMSAWLKSGQAAKMVKSSMRGRRPSPKFRQIIIDICSGLEHLFQGNVYPIKIGVEDIMTCKVGYKYFPKLLICEDKKPGTFDVDTHKNKIWEDLRNTVKTTFKECANNETIDPVSLKFFNSIGKLKSEQLQKYPDDWSMQKATYLLKIMSTDKNVAGPKVQSAGISWPVTHSGTLLSPFRQMVAYDNTRSFPSRYITTDPYDFLRICKDLIKHWLILPESVKQVCPNWEVVVERMDTWNPLIWCILYEIFK